MIMRGMKVVVARGNKVPRGTTGTVIWTGANQFGPRVGVKDAAGTVHWTYEVNCDVINTVAAPTTQAPVAASDQDRIAELSERLTKLESLVAQLIVSSPELKAAL